jgi:hypothetical protein
VLYNLHDCFHNEMRATKWSLRCLLTLQASTLGNWFTGLLQRHDQLGKWLTLGRPRAYWMTGFFNPQVSSFFNPQLHSHGI